VSTLVGGQDGTKEKVPLCKEFERRERRDSNP
jgi:hypothetical protein